MRGLVVNLSVKWIPIHAYNVFKHSSSLYQADYPESIAAFEKIWFTARKATKQANYCAQRACTFALFLTFRNNNYYESKIVVVIFSLI